MGQMVTVPHSSQISKHTFAVTVEMKDWTERYQKEHLRSTFDTFPPGLEFLKTKFKTYLPQHACQFNGICRDNKGELGKGIGKGELSKGTGKGEPGKGTGKGEPCKGTGKGEPCKGTGKGEPGKDTGNSQNNRMKIRRWKK